MSGIEEMADIDADCVTVLFNETTDGLQHQPTGTTVVPDLDIDHQHDELDEPEAKRMRGAETETITIQWDSDNVKQTLYNVNRVLTFRVQELEKKVENLVQTVKNLSNQLGQVRAGSAGQRSRGSAFVVGVPQEGGENLIKPISQTPGHSNVTLVTLNSESDYPEGVWLGDESNPEMRVRVPINNSDLLYIHSNCRTPEKMALTLLDYLFDRETQATSNLSGMGRHGKKQLDPLKIYAIKCHLIQEFGISEATWTRIRLNIDSKCRTAYRRKIQGNNAPAKTLRPNAPIRGATTHITTTAEKFAFTFSNPNTDVQLQNLNLDGPGELQIIHATEEQLAQLQQSHQIQILDTSSVHGDIFQHMRQASEAKASDVTDSDPDVTLEESELEIVPEEDAVTKRL